MRTAWGFLTVWLVLVALTFQHPAASYRHAPDNKAVVLNDLKVTPGVVSSSDTAVVCHRTTGALRNTTQHMKDSVYTLYGIKHHKAGQYEVDHLISLELGGADSIANLWPEPASPHPGFHEKDKLENWLHKQACSGKIGLRQAQTAIATNWWGEYQVMLQSAGKSH